MKEFITIILHPCGFIKDQTGARNYTNYTGGNSEYGGVWGYSCNMKDILILDKSSHFEVCSKLNLNISYPIN